MKLNEKSIDIEWAQTHLKVLSVVCNEKCEVLSLEYKIVRGLLFVKT